MFACIYKIENLVNGKFYIGSTNNFRLRKNVHFSKLNRGIHENPHLQSSYNKYGTANLIMYPILYCDTKTQKYFEQSCIDNLKPQYNICKDATKPNPRIYTLEQKEKVSREHKGKIISKETKERMSKSQTGLHRTSFQRKRISESHRFEWVFLSPKGEEVVIKNLKLFCLENNLVYSNMKSLSLPQPKSKQHKGWRFIRKGKLVC